ncbi:uncharacterized protein A4U43_C02F14730 [Asparagus officinalis]|uniref:Uncharacterized protein n=1 Tax=Asparagus officinalis TaxID=4686 RepID=A0A5P1FL42_ASPOF|nr:uncharacterized protein A4U43_C02F14730 [Asparagus officinalis]
MAKLDLSKSPVQAEGLRGKGRRQFLRVIAELRVVCGSSSLSKMRHLRLHLCRVKAKRGAPTKLGEGLRYSRRPKKELAIEKQVAEVQEPVAEEHMGLLNA